MGRAVCNLRDRWPLWLAVELQPETPLGNSSFLDSIVSGVTDHHGIPPSCLGGCFPLMVWSVDTTIRCLEGIADLQILTP